MRHGVPHIVKEFRASKSSAGVDILLREESVVINADGHVVSYGSGQRWFGHKEFQASVQDKPSFLCVIKGDVANGLRDCVLGRQRVAIIIPQ